MRKKRILTVCVAVLLVVLLCCGCTVNLQNFENTAIRQDTEAMLDALIADDLKTAYSLVSNVCTEEEFTPIFTQLQEFLGGTDTYSLEMLSISAKKVLNDGQTTSMTSVVYKMTTENGVIIVNVGVDSQNGMGRFYLTPYEKTDYYFTGTIDKMRGATVFQWVLLLSNLLAIGFAVFALVDCCRHKIKKKALWILLILFGFLSLGAMASSTGFKLNFNLGWMMAYSAMIRYGSGTVILRFMLPIGAIGYFAARRSLLRVGNAKPETVPAPAEEEPNGDDPVEQTPVEDQL